MNLEKQQQVGGTEKNEIDVYKCKMDSYRRHYPRQVRLNLW